MADDLAESTHAMSCMEIWGGNRATSKTVTLPGLNAWVYSRPYQQAESGGDVYYVSNCATGRITRLLLADVSGHGSAVASTANSLRLLMRRYVNHFQQVKFVSAMNDEFVALNKSGGFATAVVATYLAQTRRLKFSNAGHPYPLIYSSREGRWRNLETLGDSHSAGPQDLPLGILEEGIYAETELKLDVGDMVLFHTDAFIESRNERGELLGADAFLKLVSGIDSNDAETLLDRIVTKVASIYPGNLTNDDVTLLLFRSMAPTYQIPITTRILAPFRFFGGLAQAILSGGRGMPLPELSYANLIGEKVQPENPAEQHS